MALRPTGAEPLANHADRTTQAYRPAEYWSDVAEEIARRTDHREVAGDNAPFHRYQRATFLAEFLDRLPVGGQLVLEIGCGPGGNLRRIALKKPSALVGCDIAPAMIALARKGTAGLDGVEIVQVDGTTLPFPDRSFDIGFTATVLHHNEDDMLRRLIPEICRVSAHQVYLFEATGDRKRAWYSFVLRPVSEYAALCAENGFRLVQADRLRIGASLAVYSVLHKAFRILNRPEGAPTPRLEMWLQSAALPLTRMLDRLVTPNWGMTRMVFARD